MLEAMFSIWIKCPYCGYPFQIKEKKFWYFCPRCRDTIDYDFETILKKAMEFKK